MRLGADLPQGGDVERVGAAVESCMAAIELLEICGTTIRG